ncbi:MAG TPA: MFS transporter [Streptosporangiaceae bacterium]|nr:MFS transporter [Streptosporangiaceae bacterium]
MTAGPASSTLATWRGRRILALLCAVAFLDFTDASITNVALPHIRAALGFSAQDLQWVPSAYLLTYGGFMLLGGRLADLAGRRAMIVAGTSVVAVASLAGGFAGDAGVFVGARFAQGLGAALMLPAALSTLTTTFRAAGDRNKALGVWGAVAGLSSAVGILLGGVLTEGPGWRWVMFVNPIACAVIIPAVLAVLPPDRPAAARARFDFPGALLATGGMLTLVFALVKAPDQGWGAASTWGELAGAAVLLAAFGVNERKARDPLLPLGIFRTRGLLAANVTGFVAFSGLLAMFYFLTLYMQNVLGYSPVAAGAAYLPLTFAVGVSSGAGAKLATRIGSRPVIVAGALIAAAGLFLLGHVPVHGTYPPDILPGLLLVAFGIGPVFVGVTSAANAGVPAGQAGVAAAIMNSFQQTGGALGLAIMSAVATSQATHSLARGLGAAQAATSGYQHALLTGGWLAAGAAVLALWTVNSREDPMTAGPAAPADHDLLTL